MECKRCGECCINEEPIWKQANLTEKQFERLEKLIDKKTKLCRYLYIVNGKLTCLAQHHFGYEAKPKVCKDKEPCGA